MAVATSAGATVKQLSPKMMEVQNFKEVNDFRLKKFETALEQHKLHRPQGWDHLVDVVKSQKTDYDKVAMANIIINQIPYVDGTDGSYFWPQKAFQRGSVVCKDYVLLKYILLSEAGYPTDKMALVVHDSVLQPGLSAHVVLLVDIDGEPWIANQFWQGTAAEFYSEYKIDRQKLSASLKKNGADALRTDFKLAGNKYNARSLTKAQNYHYPNQVVLSVLNENGLYTGKSQDKGFVYMASNKKNKGDKYAQTMVATLDN
ncbi:transglutaminase-like cysteine proteinase BTLCP protein [Medicago truncatula]|uniref:Transglutaminase-like cysteine proteinase BTLCP protein n=2 Tax=cellular organisms TaxID=131567 RepID=A0A072TE88_MEDTR|nr:transglutaminase-like cysteine proteinase BTLCP protein [Medicago truncatula]